MKRKKVMGAVILDKGALEKITREARIKKAVEEWILRMFKFFKTRNCSGEDTDIDCPGCLTFRGIGFYPDKGWQCRNTECRFVFSDYFYPPTPQELEDYYKLLKSERRIETFISRIALKELL